jgi:signal transduction histidine kinase
LQDLSLETALRSANTSQTQQLNALANENDTLQKWRESAQTNPDPRAWYDFSTGRLTQILQNTNRAADDLGTTARRYEMASLVRAGVVAAAVVITLLIVTALLTTIARTVTGPLRRLRAGAVDIANVQLPAAVARIEQDGVAADVSLPAVLPADIPAGPETFEVARAVDDLGAEAVRLATAQVRLRRALDEAFVSMSRRSQSMVEKQLAIIDELESQEQDPDQLRNLFRLDHLAARMRRYNDNLLVLAGSAVRTRATAPVKVAELFRAATSEMEQYERVRLQPVSGASIAGTVAGELVHLLAELLDNAAMYSPPSSPIVLSAAFTADGGLQIEVLDGGVGISPGELDRLNARLTQPEAIDTQVPSRMGLFVVARLARRGGFAVMLQTRSDAAGTVALVRVPATLVVGAPGSTGEQPSTASGVTIRPATPVSGATRAPMPASFSAPELPAPSAAPAAAAAAAGAAAAAAAGIRSVDRASSDAPALPKRRRGGGLPPQASAPPAGGDLFAPATPTGEIPNRAEPASGAGAAIQRAAPPETTPTGIPSIGTRPGAGPESEPSELTDTATTSLPRPGLPQRRGPQGPAPTASDEIAEGAAETPAAGINGLPGLGAPQNRGMRAPQGPQDPLTTPSGEFRALPNPAPSAEDLTSGTGAAPTAWDDELPTELAARAAAAASYKPTNPDAPMIGEDALLDINDPTPIFDQISVWFTSEPAARMPAVESDEEKVIDLREGEGQPERQPSSRWASLGDQRWLATNARAAAAPDTEGTTETGLPLRRPGANLLPSASAAAPAAPMGLPGPGAQERPPADADTEETRHPEAPPDADLVRGRLGSYQRGLANARKARSQPAQEASFDPVGASLFTANSDAADESGRNDEQGADQ